MADGHDHHNPHAHPHYHVKDITGDTVNLVETQPNGEGSRTVSCIPVDGSKPVRGSFRLVQCEGMPEGVLRRLDTDEDTRGAIRRDRETYSSVSQENWDRTFGPKANGKT